MRLRRSLWPADAVRLCRKVVNERVLTFNAPKAQRFSGLTALSGQGLWYRPFGAMSFNAACRRLCAAKVYPHRYRGGAVKKCMNNTDITPPPVISTAAGQTPIGKPLIVQARGQLRLTWRLYAESPQSGEISLLHGQESMAAGDLSAQSIMGAFSICLP